MKKYNFNFLRDITKGIGSWGQIENFYGEKWVNDFRIEDSQQFSDMSDNEILGFCLD